ncbi:hypothetical protein MPV89_004380 [Vibrio vulnificus]|nr:hypothetical protein [Vibrio vulnificus]EIZ4670148.1 hypothetical protein [Vibrio vulnificus]
MNTDTVIVSKEKVRQIFLKLWTVLSEHYVVLSSMLISIFSLLCFVHAQTVFEQFGLNFLYFSSLSDIYSIAIATGVVSSTLIKAMMLSLFLFAAFNIREIRRYLVSKGKFFKLIWVLLAMSLVILFMFIARKQQELTMSRSLYQPAEVKQARYRLITSDDQSGRGCISLLAGTSSNLITWNFSNNQVEIIPKARVIRTDLIVRAPLRYVPNFQRQSQTREERLQELNWILKNHEEWKSLLTEKCGESYEINPMIKQEIKRLTK